MLEYSYDRILYARGLSYHDLMLMEDLVKACHKLYSIRLPMWDQLYMLNVFSYGDLQGAYRNAISERS